MANTLVAIHKGMIIDQGKKPRSADFFMRVDRDQHLKRIPAIPA